MTQSATVAGASGVCIELNGNEGMREHLGNDFREELTNLLSSAGYAGSFNVTVGTTTVKGTAFTRGLRIGQPDQSRNMVRIFWHSPKASNDGRVPLLLAAPRDMDAFRFQLRLKETAQTFATMGKKKESEGQTVVKFKPAAQSAAQAKENNVETAQASSKPSPDASSTPTDQKEKINFAKDPEKVELFYQYILNHLSPEGLVATKLCTQVLRDHFGIAKMGAGRVLYSLVKQRRLQDVANTSFYKVPAAILKRLRKQSDASRGEPAVEAQTTPTTRQRRPKAVRDSKLIGKLEVLEENAARVPLLEKEIEEIGRDIAKLEERRGKAIEDLAVCADSKAKLDRLNSALAELDKDE